LLNNLICDDIILSDDVILTKITFYFLNNLICDDIILNDGIKLVENYLFFIK